MRSIILAGVAAMALTAPALAQPSKGNNGGSKGGGNAPAKVERGSGGGQAQRAERQQVRGLERQEARADRQQDRAPKQRDVRAARSKDIDRRHVREERREDRGQQQREVRVDRDRREGRDAVVRVQEARGQDRADFRRVDYDRRDELFVSNAASKIYLFNYMDSDTALDDNTRYPELLTQLTDATKARRHVVTYKDTWAPGEVPNHALPVNLEPNSWRA